VWYHFFLSVSESMFYSHHCGRTHAKTKDLITSNMNMWRLSLTPLRMEPRVPLTKI